MLKQNDAKKKNWFGDNADDDWPPITIWERFCFNWMDGWMEIDFCSFKTNGFFPIFSLRCFEL